VTTHNVHTHLLISCKGEKLSKQSLSVARQKVKPKLSVIENYITTIAQDAAEQGVQYIGARATHVRVSCRIGVYVHTGLQSVTIEFKSSHQDFYSFLSNFSHRELLLHDLLAQKLDVSFSDMTTSQGHSCITPAPIRAQATHSMCYRIRHAFRVVYDNIRKNFSLTHVI
jgi:hypothetical protein